MNCKEQILSHSSRFFYPLSLSPSPPPLPFPLSLSLPLSLPPLPPPLRFPSPFPSHSHSRSPPLTAGLYCYYSVTVSVGSPKHALVWVH